MSSPEEGNGPEKKESENELAAPTGPKVKAKCREKEEKSPAKPSELSKMERKEVKNMNKSTRKDAKSARMGPRTLKPMAVKAEERSRKSVREAPAKSYHFQTPKDETELACLQLEGELAQQTKAMEEYRFAMQQIYNILAIMIRRGNGTTDADNFKSDKGQAAAEKLNREVVQTENFWKTDTRLQPAFNDSIAKNTTILAAAERHLQEQGPKHLKKTKRFLNDHWLRYVDMKKTLAKIVKQQKPDSQGARDEQIKAITVFVKEKYLNMKSIHLGEIQSVIAELSLFHHTSSASWHQIAERKPPKSGYVPETFDFKQFFAPPPKT
ncbi:hypothetical protein CRE_11801 [Caenorhabditis remanei]|uniref:Uncharacterized protein n=1 Tax=Caenorhabditis remanei TaxID=31234 RepID=E3M4R3_CAERE|nr:hypothetical protein CRE_11801 [Caenorhabditis remanei]